VSLIQRIKTKKLAVGVVVSDQERVLFTLEPPLIAGENASTRRLVNVQGQIILACHVRYKFTRLATDAAQGFFLGCFRHVLKGSSDCVGADIRLEKTEWLAFGDYLVLLGFVLSILSSRGQ